MAVGNVPTSNLTNFYNNTTPGTTADPAALDNAIIDIVQTVNDNHGFAAGLVSAGTLSKLGIINVKDYNASGLATTAVGSITTGTKGLTLTTTPDFVAGQGINLQGVAEVASLLVTAAATATANCTVTLNGVAKTVALVSGDTTTGVATKIRAATFAGWTTGGTGTTVTFTSTTTGIKTDATYSAGTTGATGTMTTTTQGIADQITTVSSVAGLVVNIADNATRTITAGTILHDDTVAIQAAIDSLGTIGGIVAIPQGRFRTKTFQMKSNIWLKGAGKASVIDIIDDGTATSTFVQLNTISNVKISDITIEQSNAVSRSSNFGLVKADLSNNVIISKVNFGKATSTAIHTTKCVNWLIEGCDVGGTFADGFHISRESKKIRIIGNRFEDTGDDAIGIIGYIDAPTNYGKCEDIIISGNTIYDSDARGIVVNGGRNVVIADNTIRMTQKAGIQVGNGANIHNNLGIIIKGNTIQDTGNVGSGDISGIYFGYCRFGIISENIIDDSQGDGITIFPLAQDLTISDNQLSRAGRGIFVDQTQSTDSLVLQELYTDVGESATVAGVSNLKIISNTIMRMNLDGIYVDGEATLKSVDVIISKNTIYKVNGNNVVSRNIFLNYCDTVEINNNIGKAGVFALSANIAYANSTNVNHVKRTESGSSTTDTVSTAFSSKAITFNIPYTSTPDIVIIGGQNADDYRWKVQSITTTGFTAVGIKDDLTTAATGISFQWISMGQ